MKLRAFFISAVCIIGVLCLSACGSGGSTDSPDPNVPLTEAPELNSPKVFEGALAAPGSASVERFLKNGIYVNSIDFTQSDNYVVVPSPSEGASTGSTSNFSGTTLIENGVDEADRIKYDGEYMYVAQAGEYFLSEPTPPEIRILKRNDDFSLDALPNLVPSYQFSRVDGMFLHNDKLTVIGVDRTNYVFDAIATSYLGATGDLISVSIFDVENPSQAIESSAFQIEGDIVGTRRIDNNIYIVSRFVPRVDALTPFASTNAEKLSNYNKVNNTPISDLMPKRYQNEQGTALNSPEDCYLPAQASNVDGYAELVTVTKIDITDPDNMQSLCMSINPSMMYMSPNNLYFAGNVFDETQGSKTQIHKFDLAQFEYSASGSAVGEMGWRANALFRINESEDKLRILTTQYLPQGPVHSLHVLEQDGDELINLASLPNSQRPEAIGKPNEEVFAVRFVNDKAYVVTFELTDPLYVINLIDQADPFIEGSLEIPGFSSYIQPLENGYLLGIGQEVRANDLPAVGSDPNAITIPPQTLGTKISLFDVRDPSEPTELTSLFYSSAYSPAEFDYKALSVLNTQGKYQFALPLEQWTNVVTNGSSYVNSLLLLETDTLDSVPSLRQVNQVIAESNESFYYGGYLDRSIIQADKVYYLHGDLVWMSDWDVDGEVLGPY